MSSLSARIAVILCIVLVLSNLTASMSRPQRNDVASVQDALRYLQELDSIYSQIARPRLVRSGSSSEEPELETAIGLLRLETLDRIYSKHTRPRFGKRNSLLRVLNDDNQEDQEDEWRESNPFPRS